MVDRGMETIGVTPETCGERLAVSCVVRCVSIRSGDEETGNADTGLGGAHDHGIHAVSKLGAFRLVIPDGTCTVDVSVEALIGIEVESEHHVTVHVVRFGLAGLFALAVEIPYSIYELYTEVEVIVVVSRIDSVRVNDRTLMHTLESLCDIAGDTLRDQIGSCPVGECVGSGVTGSVDSLESTYLTVGVHLIIVSDKIVTCGNGYRIGIGCRTGVRIRIGVGIRSRTGIGNDIRGVSTVGMVSSLIYVNEVFTTCTVKIIVVAPADDNVCRHSLASGELPIIFAILLSHGIAGPVAGSGAVYIILAPSPYSHVRLAHIIEVDEIALDGSRLRHRIGIGCGTGNGIRVRACVCHAQSKS